MGNCKFLCPKKKKQWDILNLDAPKNGTFLIYMSQKIRSTNFICPKEWDIVKFNVPKNGTFVNLYVPKNGTLLCF